MRLPQFCWSTSLWVRGYSEIAAVKCVDRIIEKHGHVDPVNFQTMCANCQVVWNALYGKYISGITGQTKVGEIRERYACQAEDETC